MLSSYVRRLRIARGLRRSRLQEKKLSSAEGISWRACSHGISARSARVQGKEAFVTRVVVAVGVVVRVVGVVLLVVVVVVLVVVVLLVWLVVVAVVVLVWVLVVAVMVVWLVVLILVML